MTLKTYANDFTIKVKLGDFATLQSTGLLSGIHKPTPKEAKAHLVTPDTQERVKQFYVAESKVGQKLCPTDLLTAAECGRAVSVKDKMTDVTDVTVLNVDALADAQVSSLPKNIMNVTVHTAAAVDDAMFPEKDGQSYVFYPDKKDPDNIQNYNLLFEILKRSDLAFCSVVNLQNHEGLFRLQVWRGRIVLVKQGFSDRIVEHTVPSEGEFAVAPIPESVITKALKGFAKMSEPLDPVTYRDRVLEEKLAVKAAADNGEVVAAKAAPAVKPSTSLEDLFAGFGE